MKNTEHNLQSACVKWFRLQYPKYQRLLLAFPNGAKRDPRSGKWYKDEGMLAGAPDLVLFVSNADYNTLCVEMKTEKGRQSASQVLMEIDLENAKNKYVICRSFEDFRNEIEKYLKNNR